MRKSSSSSSRHSFLVLHTTYLVDLQNHGSASSRPAFHTSCSGALPWPVFCLLTNAWRGPTAWSLGRTSCEGMVQTTRRVGARIFSGYTAGLSHVGCCAGTVLCVVEILDRPWPCYRAVTEVAVECTRDDSMACADRLSALLVRQPP